MQNKYSHFDVKRKASGRWREILSSAGVPECSLVNKHSACPFCGGKDRWRWDDKRNSGSGICNQCGAGDGFYILAKALNLNCRTDFPKLLEFVSEFVRGKPFSKSPSEHPNTEPWTDLKSEKMRDLSIKIWNESEALNSLGCPAGIEYLLSRGLELLTLPTTIRSHPGCAYRNDDGSTTNHPALIAKVVDSSDRICGVHRIFLTDKGIKASVQRQKMSLGPIKGGAVRLTEAFGHVCIGEGIETMIAVHLLSGDPVWSALSASGLSSFDPPRSIKFVDIYADRDANGCGLKAAHDLMVRLVKMGRKVRIFLPPTAIPCGAKSWDWLDEYLKRKGQ